MKRWISLLIATQLLTATAFAKGRIQNEDIKSLTDITAAVLTTTGNLTSGNACIASPGSTSGLATGLFIYDTTTSANVSSGSTIAGLPGSCSAGQIQMSATAAGSGTGDTLTFGGQGSQLINDSKIWLTSLNPNTQLSTAISKGLISGSGGSKNYLSTYVASFGSGNANAGNGNFEQGTTTGWSLGTVGTLTNGLPTGSPTFGSGASGNLSISVISSNQIAGNYSLSYASSAATTQSNMLASSGAFLDASDQGKVLTVKFSYSTSTGSSNVNYSGTSSNSYAWAVYDVTNSSWLTSQGNFCMTQSSGTGQCTGTVQTNSNTQQIRMVFYNANATAGAATLYLDDFSVGPQTAPIGPVVTDWKSFTMTVTSTGSSPTKGTTSQDNAQWRRVGDMMEIAWDYQQSGAGSSGSGNYLLALPNGAAIDTTKVSVTGATIKAIVGQGSFYQPDTALSGNNSGDNNEPLVVIPYDSTHLGVVYQSSDNTGFGSGGFIMLDYSKQIWNSGAVNFATGNFGMTIRARVPIAGWSSNVQMSSDTDTRIISARYTNNAGTSLTANTTNIDWSTQVYDTSASWNGTTFTAPVTGFYEVKGTMSLTSSAAVSMFGYVNGTKTIDLSGMGELSTSVHPFLGQVKLNAGDTFTVRQDGTVTLNNSGGSTNHWISITRVSGPAVVAASEKVFAQYTNNGATSITASTTNIDFSTKVVDSHASWNGTVFTAPSSGMYSIKGSVSINANTAMSMFAYVNGSKSYILTGDEGTSHVFHSFHGDFKLNAGDTLSVRSDTGVTLSNSNGQFNHWISILSQ